MSSSYNEDSIISSNASTFRSFFNIDTKNKNNLKKMDLVFRIYNRLNIENDEVIIREIKGQCIGFARLMFISLIFVRIFANTL